MLGVKLNDLDLDGREIDVNAFLEEFPDLTISGEYVSGDKAALASMLKEFFDGDDTTLEADLIEEFEPQGDKDQEISDEVGEASTAFDDVKKGDIIKDDNGRDRKVKNVGEKGIETTDELNVDVVDTTDGVDADEAETLYQALMKLDPEKRAEVISRLSDLGEDDESDSYPAYEEAKKAVGYTENKGNALAKLIGSLKF